MRPLPFTRQEMKALVVLGATGLLGLTAAWMATVAPPPRLATVTINVNTCSAEALEALPGIGPVTARRIVEEREVHGRFLHVEDLRRVKGLSSKTIAALRSRLRLE